MIPADAHLHLKNQFFLFFLLFIIFLIAYKTAVHLQIMPDDNHSFPYRLVKNWPLTDPALVYSQPSGLGIDTEQNIFVFNRTGRIWKEPFPDSTISGNTVFMLDRNSGKVLNSWGANRFIMPHGLTVDKNNHVWLTDVGLHQVFEFDHDGRLLMTLGKAKIPGNDSAHFNRPTDVAVSDDGSFYVSDGYGNSRVVKFSPSGKYLFSWGKKGSGAGEFNLPHAIDLDAEGNVYVADRQNNRIQVFDSEGKFLRQIKGPGFKNLYSLAIEKNSQHIFATDYLSFFDILIRGSDIYQLDLSGKMLLKFGRTGNFDGPPSRYHNIVPDRDGNIYVTEILKNGLQKFVK
jgi:peptidylamidoglycolate lyase